MFGGAKGLSIAKINKIKDILENSRGTGFNTRRFQYPDTLPLGKLNHFLA
jgi:hypothetical protein